MAASGYTGPAPTYKALLPSPSQIIQFSERAQQMREQKEAARIQQAMDQNAKTLDKAFEYRANPVISQYQGYFDQQVKDVYSKAKSLYYESNPSAKMAVSQQMADIDGQLNVVKDMEEQMNKVRELAKGDSKRYNTQYINNNLYGSIYDDKGELKDPKTLDPSGAYNILQDHRAYNLPGLNEAFSKDIDEVVNYSFKSVSRGGIKFLQKYKEASKLAQLDSEGNPIYDKSTGRIQLNVTPDLVNKYLQDDGRRLWAEKLVAEKQEAGDKNYNFKNAVEELLQGTGYARKTLSDQEVLDKSALNNSYIGGSAEKDQQYKASAEYFYNLINGDEKTKQTLLGDISSGKEFSASYSKAPQVEGAQVEPSNKGYVEIKYDPLSKFADFMDQLFEKELKSSLGLSDQEVKELKETARKDHKILVNLDNEEQAWRELNYWRNLARNQDLNSDLLKGAYDEYAKKRSGSMKLVKPTAKKPKLEL